MAFSEQGVAMLSSVLRSKRAIQVNIQIMRAFTRLRRLLAGYQELRSKIEKMEEKYDQNFQVVFEAIKLLLEVEAQPKRRIGFTGEKSALVPAVGAQKNAKRSRPDGAAICTITAEIEKGLDETFGHTSMYVFTRRVSERCLRIQSNYDI